MSEFYGSVLTNAGISLLTRAMQGTASIEFTAFVTGDGSYSETERGSTALMARTALKNQKQSVPFTSVTRPTGQSVILNATVENEDLSSGYYIREVGIYAKNRDVTSEEAILYAVAVAKVPDYMPPYNGLLPTSITEQFITTVSNSAEITITTLGANMTVDEFSKYGLTIKDGVLCAVFNA